MLIIVLGLCFLSCGQSTEPVPADIARARQLWEQSRFNSYFYEFRQDCNCIYGGKELTVLVIDKKIESVRDTNHVNIDSSDYQWFYTIDQLFDKLEAISRENPDKFEYTFNADYGYPTYIYVDFSLQVADDEFSYTLKNLQNYVVIKTMRR